MKYALPAFALLWLAMIYASVLYGHEYFVAELARTPDDKTLIVASAQPYAVSLGLKPGARVDTAVLPIAERLRLQFGAHKGTLLRVPVWTGPKVKIVVVPALQEQRYEPLTIRVFDLASMTFALLLAAFLGYRRPGAMIGALVLYLGAGALSWPAFAIFMSALPDTLYAAVTLVLALLCDFFPVLVLASFAVRFPGEDGPAEKRAAVRVIDSIVILGFFAGIPRYLLAGGVTPFVICTALSAMVVIAASILSLRYAKPSDRARVGIVFAAVMIGGVGYAAAMIWLQYGGNFLAFFVYGTLSVIIVPLAVTYAILRHRVFDIAFVLNRTLVYAITSALILVALAAMEFAAERYLSDLTRVEGILIEFAIALTIMMTIRVVHNRVDRAVDNVLFRARHEEESALRRFAGTVPFYTEQAALIRDTLDALARYGRVHGAAIYMPAQKQLQCAASAYSVPALPIDENDPAYVELRAHREQLHLRGSSTAFLGERLYPMFLAGRLLGVISIGARETGEQMPPDINEAIERVGASLAIALAAVETDRIRQENAALYARLGISPA
jgi:hypothetical protein